MTNHISPLCISLSDPSFDFAIFWLVFPCKPKSPWSRTPSARYHRNWELAHSRYWHTEIFGAGIGFATPTAMLPGTPPGLHTPHDDSAEPTGRLQRDLENWPRRPRRSPCNVGVLRKYVEVRFFFETSQVAT